MPQYQTTRSMEWADPERQQLERKLAEAEALRTGGMSNDIGGGYQGGKVFIVGNPLSNIAKSIGGAYIGNEAEKAHSALMQARQQAEQAAYDKLAGISPTEQKTYSLPENVAGPVGTETVNKTPQQLMQEQQAAIAGFAPTSQMGQALKQAVATKQFNMPYDQLTRQENAEARAELARENNAARLFQATEAQKQRAADLQAQRERDFEHRKEMARIIAANRPQKEPSKASTAASDKAEIRKQASASALNTLDNMAENIANLEEGKGLVGGKQGPIGNVATYISNLPLAQEAQRAYGGKNQGERDMLESRRMQLLTELKQAKGLSASEMNSNFELQKRLEALGGNRMNVDSLKEIMDDTRQLFGGERKYGKGRTVSGTVSRPAPAGVDPADWKHMTPEEQALWQ